MGKIYEELVDCLHCDDECYKDLSSLEEVFDVALSLMHYRLSDPMGRLPEYVLENYGVERHKFKEYLFTKWESYNDFWEDVYA